ncbi:DUF58 domain-containing protein [Permianibacter sp. IMCC34836]|uniref:DUF58 domain-containing protein n=1 Tax=Permianibacter fluminis TaxID=2738515 RepID=UPI001553C310|nr:DUF58 domain-containing protein [Permianibacter fluminis]NQD38663.1 DUF58 domain-containing protein [Permianibacter fluminis]
MSTPTSPIQGVELTLAELLQLELRTRHATTPRYVDSPGGTQYRTRLKGRGMDYDETRSYQPGDEIRHMDWRVTARTGKAHTKVFRAERERPVLLLLDQSLPMFFGSRHALKSVLAARLFARALWRALGSGDRVGARLYSEHGGQQFTPSHRRSLAVHVLHQLVQAHQQQLRSNKQGELASDELLNRQWQTLRAQALHGYQIQAFVNLASCSEAQQPALSWLARHNELRIYPLYDQLEAELPPPGHYLGTDGSARLLLDTSDTSLRQQYQQRFAAIESHLLQFCRQQGVLCLPLSASDGLAHGLKQFEEAA